jgi:hypothetical protein
MEGLHNTSIQPMGNPPCSPCKSSISGALLRLIPIHILLSLFLSLSFPILDYLGLDAIQGIISFCFSLYFFALLVLSFSASAFLDLISSYSKALRQRLKSSFLRNHSLPFLDISILFSDCRPARSSCIFYSRS